MLSVHALVDGQRREFGELHTGVRPIQPKEIADILKENDTDVGRSRQRRAGLRLLALAGSPRAPDDLRRQARGAAERLLSPEEVSYVLSVLERVNPRDSCQAPPEDVEPIVADLLPENCIGTCCWSGDPARIQRHDKAITLNMDLAFTGITLDKAAQGLDPQNWDDCSTSGLWAETHLCQLNADGTPKETNGVCDKLTTIPPGTNYGGMQKLYEHFTCEHNLCSVELYLDTQVSYPNGPSGYDLWYTNPQPIGTSPVIDPDQGGVQMYTDGTSIGVHSRKTFGFSHASDAVVVDLMLHGIETTHYLGELVCCKR
jgi:hypothetical protein